MNRYGNEKILYDIWLTTRLSAGSKAYERLFEYYSTAYDIYRAEPDELESLGTSARLISSLSSKDLRHAEQALNFCLKKDVKLILRGDADYPECLATIPNPPYALYVKGSIASAANDYSTAIVGTRTMSEYGMRMAYKISYELAAAGATVVSGMALGVDGVAAVGALEAHGDTIAVLGCGLDKVYPSAHRRLMGFIAERGALVSEYAPGTPPLSGNFPVRNRIISGLARSTLVIEGGVNSGSMLTAREAIRQGRDIFALPGNIGASNSLGTNVLIRDGARVALSARDVLGIRDLDGINLDRLADAELESDLDVNVLLSYGVAPASIEILSSVVHEQSTETVPLKSRNAQKEEHKAHKKEASPAKEQIEQQSQSAPSLPELENGMLKELYDSMPVGKAVTADFFSALVSDSGELVGYLSMLEVMGYIISIPGGTYLREI